MTKPLLPSIDTLASYRAIYRRASAWRPAMRLICQRHALDAATLRQGPPGSHILFWVEEDWLIKLFTPLFPSDAPTETLLLHTLAAQHDFNIPHVRCQGEIEDWPYLVLSRLPGRPLDELWPALSPAEKEPLAASLGRLIAALHHTPTAGLEALRLDWPDFLAAQVAACVERQRQAGAPESWLEEIAAFLADLPPLYEPGFQPALLNADLNPEHLFCEQSPSGWQITGLIDFGDALLGHPYYEFVAPGLFLHHAPRLRRCMLEAYGLAPGELTAQLSRRLLAHTLLHRFFNLPEWLGLLGETPPRNLVELQKTLWKF